MNNTIVSVENLQKTFEIKRGIFGKAKSVHAVNGVSFDIKKGETFSLVGESGCGKSTIGRLMDHLITPTDGKIIFEGKNISSLSDNDMRPIRKDIQVIFQDPYGSLNPRIKVQDLIAEPLLIHTDLNKKERILKVHDLLREVGLRPEHGNRYPHEFSGGQRQRIGIARALSVHPKLIIADEPVSALDVSIQAQVLNLLGDLQNKYDLTYLFISHDLSVVEMISDRIAVMYLGSIMEIGEKETIYSYPMHPYTRALLSAVPIPDPTKRHKRILLKGDLPSNSELPKGCLFASRCSYCTEKCLNERPDLLDMGNGHTVRCHYPIRDGV